MLLQQETDMVFGHGKNTCYVHRNGDGAISETDVLIKVCIYVNKAKWFVLLTEYCAGDKIKKNEMGWVCGVYGWGEGGV